MFEDVKIKKLTLKEEDVKIEKLTLKETEKVIGGNRAKPGGTTGGTEDYNCYCCCG